MILTNDPLMAFLSVITRQLLARNPGLCTKLGIDNQVFELKEHVRYFRAAVESFGVTYIVLDAFDEFSAEHDDRIELAEQIVELRELVDSRRLRFCITSRKADDVLAAFVASAVARF